MSHSIVFFFFWRDQNTLYSVLQCKTNVFVYILIIFCTHITNKTTNKYSCRALFWFWLKNKSKNIEQHNNSYKYNIYLGILTILCSYSMAIEKREKKINKT